MEQVNVVSIECELSMPLDQDVALGGLIQLGSETFQIEQIKSARAYGQIKMVTVKVRAWQEVKAG